jgi:hypothetical protein
MALRLSPLRAGSLIPGNHFNPRAIVRLEGLGKLEKIKWRHWQSSIFTACSKVPSPTTLPCAHIRFIITACKYDNIINRSVVQRSVSVPFMCRDFHWAHTGEKTEVQTVHQLFTDFKKAYDTDEGSSLHSLIESGVPMKLVSEMNSTTL